MIQFSANAVKDGGDMLAHPSPVRAVTSKVYLTGLGEQSFILIGHYLHHIIGETPLQKFQHRADLPGALFEYVLPLVFCERCNFNIDAIEF